MPLNNAIVNEAKALGIRVELGNLPASALSNPNSRPTTSTNSRKVHKGQRSQCNQCKGCLTPKCGECSGCKSFKKSCIKQHCTSVLGPSRRLSQESNGSGETFEMETSEELISRISRISVNHPESHQPQQAGCPAVVGGPQPP